MTRDTGLQHPQVLGLLRAYAVLASLLVLLPAPFFLGQFAIRRVFPVELSWNVRADGSTSPAGRGHEGETVIAISMDGGEWLAPGTPAVARRLSVVPTGTPISYRIEASGSRRESTGLVVEQPRTASDSTRSLALGLLALGLAISGLAIVSSGLDRRAFLAGASLSGLGTLFAGPVAEASLPLIGDARLRELATAAWGAFPRSLSLWILCLFLSVFPGFLWRRRWARWLTRLCLLSVVSTWLVTAAIELPGVVDRLPLGAQLTAVRWSLGARAPVLATSVTCVLMLLAGQVREYRLRAIALRDRNRAQFAGLALIVGVAPVLFLAFLQTASLIARGRLLVPPVIMAVSFLPLLLAPAALAYATLSPDVEPLRLLVRRAALFSFGEKTVRVVSLIPLVGLLVFLYRNRGEGIGDLVSAHPWPFGIAVVAALTGLLYRDRARRALERVFFRDRADVRRLMADLAEKSRAANDPVSLERLLSGEIGRALHAESVALFVRDRVSCAFVCPSRSLPTLDFDSALAGAAGTRGILDLDPADRRSPLASLPEIERHWVEESRARLLLPLSGADGTVIGLLAVGENLSELPWEEEDKRLLVAAAASGALVLENSLLRSSAGSGAVVGRLAPRHEEDLARCCHLCSQIFSSALGSICPKDQVPLTVAGVPHVLAGKYRFERRIGSGGMGVVYLARDLSLGRFVAVKTLPKVSPEAAMRLRREARATARVLHPNLAVIFAAETWHGTPMLLLEYLEGGTLAPRIARGPIPIERIVEWGIALSGALEAAHAKGVLHRDIKPSNIGFTASGEPKLLDFGLASLFEEPELLAAVETATKRLDMLETAELKHMTMSGRIVGTLPYLAPEAILGETPQVSFDLWSLALTLYEATTGSNPFFEMPAEKTLNRILSLTPPPARVLRADCPEELSAFLANALARTPGQRPRSAREFRRALQRLASVLAA